MHPDNQKLIDAARADGHGKLCDLLEWTAAERDRYEARLCISPGGDDEIDGLNFAVEMLRHDLTAMRHRAEAAEREVASKQQGFDDLHALVPGPGNIWTKVDELRHRAERAEAELTAHKDLTAAERAALSGLRRDLAWMLSPSQRERHGAALAALARVMGGGGE
jgi:hypothetical protein